MDMRRIDISMPLFPGMPRFPGDPEVAVTAVRSVERGDPYSLSSLALGSHTGTHIDPPSHFQPGALSADRVDPEVLNGECVVVDVDPRATEIGPEEVARLDRLAERVLFRTANSARWSRSLTFFSDYVGLTVPAAEALVERGARLVGIDALSIENDASDTFPVHQTLLSHGVVVLEGLLLADAPAGTYALECLPVRLRDGDGAPARAYLGTR